MDRVTCGCCCLEETFDKSDHKRLDPHSPCLLCCHSNCRLQDDCHPLHSKDLQEHQSVLSKFCRIISSKDDSNPLSSSQSSCNTSHGCHREETRYSPSPTKCHTRDSCHDGQGCVSCDSSSPSTCMHLSLFLSPSLSLSSSSSSSSSSSKTCSSRNCTLVTSNSSENPAQIHRHLHFMPSQVFLSKLFLIQTAMIALLLSSSSVSGMPSTGKFCLWQNHNESPQKNH